MKNRHYGRYVGEECLAKTAAGKRHRVRVLELSCMDCNRCFVLYLDGPNKGEKGDEICEWLEHAPPTEKKK